MVLPHIKNSDLFDVWVQLKKLKLMTPNIGLITDTICCPGMDYCALATARSIPISQKISKYFKAESIQQKIGNIKIKISGCINACGHHHVGNIGILGLDRKVRRIISNITGRFLLMKKQLEKLLDHHFQNQIF